WSNVKVVWVPVSRRDTGSCKDWYTSRACRACRGTSRMRSPVKVGVVASAEWSIMCVIVSTRAPARQWVLAAGDGAKTLKAPRSKGPRGFRDGPDLTAAGLNPTPVPTPPTDACDARPGRSCRTRSGLPLGSARAPVRRTQSTGVGPVRARRFPGGTSPLLRSPRVTPEPDSESVEDDADVSSAVPPHQQEVRRHRIRPMRCPQECPQVRERQTPFA